MNPVRSRKNKEGLPGMYWLNMPEKWQVKQDKETGEKQLKVIVPAETDYWRHTIHQFVKDDAPFYWKFVYGDFEARLTVKGKFLYLYDMAGLMVRQNEDQWATCGICNYQDQRFLSKNKQQLYVSCNTTRQKSDWSTHRLLLKHKVSSKPDKRIKNTTFHVWVRRIGSLLECYYSLDNENWTMVREAYFAPEIRRLRVGMVCMAPESAGFSVTFSNFMIRGGEKMPEDYVENLVYKSHRGEFLGMLEKHIVDEMTRRRTEKMWIKYRKEQKKLEEKERREREEQEKLLEQQRLLEAAAKAAAPVTAPTAAPTKKGPVKKGPKRTSSKLATIDPRTTISSSSSAVPSQKNDVVPRKPPSTRSFSVTPIEEVKNTSSYHRSSHDRSSHGPSSAMSLSTTSSSVSSTKGDANDVPKNYVNRADYTNFKNYSTVTRDSGNRKLTNHYAKMPRRPPTQSGRGPAGRRPQSNRPPVRGGGGGGAGGRGPRGGRPPPGGRRPGPNPSGRNHSTRVPGPPPSGRIPGPPPPGRGSRPPRSMSTGPRPQQNMKHVRAPQRRISAPVKTSTEKEREQEETKRYSVPGHAYELTVAETDVPKSNPFHLMLSGRNPMAKKGDASSSKKKWASNKESPTSEKEKGPTRRNSTSKSNQSPNSGQKSNSLPNEGKKLRRKSSASPPNQKDSSVATNGDEKTKAAVPAKKQKKKKVNRSKSEITQDEMQTTKKEQTEKMKQSKSEGNLPELALGGGDDNDETGEVTTKKLKKKKTNKEKDTAPTTIEKKKKKGKSKSISS
mmetsp:Transcript_24914/g.59153  ORF Transcript_24914/g.59153 Transcript_24914/m.59153 type:complete len:784 (+) Transcript_24914:187-2538(+)